MESPNYILDEQLPLTQDFKSLKAEALTYIQQYSGNEWSNLNASDPGITILDQVCFALTELGYCNDFSVEDILTKPNGDLYINNQFYLPEDILTTSPITIIDYRKYLIDGIPLVNNAVIVSAVNDLSIINGVYQVYLLIDDSVSYAKAIDDICTAAFYYLNKHRNLGEIFLKPKPLQLVSQLIKGSIEIEDGNELNKILALIQNAINNFIFPKITATGYDQLIADGITSNIIYNGPLLENGWIDSNDLTDKKAQIFSIELAHLIEVIPGVKGVSSLSFINTPKATDSVVVEDPSQLLSVDIKQSALNGLDIYCKGVKLSINTAVTATVGPLKQQSVNVVFGAVIDTEPTVPKGTYREINDYYSIQNTFPEIFAVGTDARNSNAFDYQIAQSRQLKGYLTLFDQLLANQFSQLANVHRLFSFKNSTVGTPSDWENYYAEKDKYERQHEEYPIPYKVFSPTYYYQSLYDVPHIKPLLKNHETFSFSMAIGSEQELEINSWKEYREDPYNPYIKGLMDFMEDENNSLNRRNDILDHLLARHGESPLVINSIINGSQYTGNSLKDRVIFKSLYLQNLGLLSYYRQKAYSYFGANKIAATLTDVTDSYEEKILGGYTKDFIFRSNKIDHAEKLTERDFINYSAFELKLNLLFGLKVIYKNFIASNYNNADSDENLKLALWMIHERKGFIMLETGLLAQYANFNITFREQNITGVYWTITTPLNYNQAIIIDRFLRLVPPPNLADQLRAGTLIVDGVPYTIQKVIGPMEATIWKPITSVGYFYNVKISSGAEIDQFEDNLLFANKVELIFPSFIGEFITYDFKNRLSQFCNSNLPVHVPCQCHFVDSDMMQKLISAFANWHNAMVYQDRASTTEIIPVVEYAGTLTSLLTQLID